MHAEQYGCSCWLLAHQAVPIQQHSHHAKLRAAVCKCSQPGGPRRFMLSEVSQLLLVHCFGQQNVDDPTEQTVKQAHLAKHHSFPLCNAFCHP